MKNILLTISISALLLAGQSATAGSQDEEVIPVLSTSIEAETNHTFQLLSFLNDQKSEALKKDMKDPYSLDYSNDK